MAIVIREYFYLTGGSFSADFPTFTAVEGDTFLTFTHYVTSSGGFGTTTHMVGGNDAWTTYVSVDATGSNHWRAQYLQNCVGGSCQIRMNYVISPTSPRCYMVVVGGVSATSFQYGNSRQQNSPTTSTDLLTSNDLDVSVAPAVLIGWCHNHVGLNVPNLGTGFTDIGSSDRARTEYKLLGVTGTDDATFTATFNQAHFTVGVVLTEAGGAAGGQPAVRRMGGIPHGSRVKGVW